jgi:phosphoribosylformylglycinamidine cyclo-ligase
VFKGISQDALVMNVDDIACTGLVSDFSISNTIGRNKFLVPGDVIAAIINGYQEFADAMGKLGVNLFLCGGETADVGDLVRTVIVDSTVMVQGSRNAIIETSNIAPGDVIVGIASTGKASYEQEENSGISSNGITMARHAVLHRDYMVKYPEIADPAVDKNLAYAGTFHLDEIVPGTSMSVGKAMLSPTRTYIPVLKDVLGKFATPKEMKTSIHGIIHATGGGMTKCGKFGSGVRYIKDTLFPVPSVFTMIQEAGKVAWEEMYKVFNMGHRLEIMCVPAFAEEIISTTRRFGIEAKVIGHVEKNSPGTANTVVVKSPNGTFIYE